MNECLRCGEVCEQATFCDNCQSSLLQRSSVVEYEKSVSPVGTLPDHLVTQTTLDVQLDSAPERISILLPDTTLNGVSQQSNINHTPVVVERYAKEVASIRGPRVDRRLRMLRRAFFIMAALAAVILIFDCVLVSLIMIHRHNIPDALTPPELSLSAHSVYPGQIVSLHLNHFASSARVLLTRDIAETLRIEPSSSLVQVNQVGEGDVRVLVEDTWRPGLHYIQAEDVGTHYTASTTLHIIGSRAESAPHLQISQTTLNMGTDFVGANTLQSLELDNTGGGIVTWVAKSEQPWLILAPTQGIFTSSQRIILAADRAGASPGNYQGSITFYSNAGDAVRIQVKMAVQALPARVGAMQVIDPPVRSFSAIDGDHMPSEQTVIVRNTGFQPLSWSAGSISPTVSVDQRIPLFADEHWVDVVPHAGVLAPGGSQQVHLIIHSDKLLPSVYTGVLMFTAGHDTLNNPQSLALSLQVQPRCGIVPPGDRFSLPLSNAGGQSGTLPINFHIMSSCSVGLNWDAYTLSNWLSVDPVHGLVTDKRNALVTVRLKQSVPPGVHEGLIAIVVARHMQIIPIQISQVMPLITTNGNTDGGKTGQLGGQSSLAKPGDPPSFVLATSQITFNAQPGQASLPAQAVGIANRGRSVLQWQATSDFTASWLTVSNAVGILDPGQSDQVWLAVDASTLAEGTYTAHVTLTAINQAGEMVMGSPQMVTVTVNVAKLCSLSASPDHLTFDSSLLQMSPPGQTLRLKASGGCVGLVSWSATTDKSWILLSSTSGSDSGNGSTVVVNVNTGGKLLGTYQGQITFTVVDNSDRGQTTVQVPVSLTVLG